MKKQDILEEMKKRFKEAEESFAKQRDEADEDFRFYLGEQWTNGEKKDRGRDGRPCLSFNRLKQPVNQIAAQQQKARPCINIIAGDNAANDKTANVLQSIIHNSERISDAYNAYDTAFLYALICGEGYFRITPKYKNAMTFDQDIYIEPIEDIFSVYIDPNFGDDLTDISYAFVSTMMPIDEYKETYPDSEITVSNNFSSYIDNDWVDEGYIRITEYFRVEYEKKTVVLLDNGITMLKSDYDKIESEEKPEIKKSRVETFKSIRWSISNGVEILEDKDFVGDYIPIVPVFAKTVKFKGERFFDGVIRQSKSSQKQYNYYQNKELEVIAQSPMVPWIVSEGSIEGHEQDWADSNKVNIPFLQVKGKDSMGQQAIAPYKPSFDNNINTIVTAKMGANEDIKATTGIYDPSLGKEETGDKSSGIAVMTKQRQSEVMSFMYIDNLSKSLTLAGKIMLSMIPKIYSMDRVVKLINKNKTEFIDLSTDFEVNWLEGEYDVDVTTGPYGANQRQEALQNMLNIVNIRPDLLESIGDLLFEEQDFINSDKVTERFRKMLKPELRDDDENQEANQISQMQDALGKQQAIIDSNAMQMEQMQAALAEAVQMFNEAQGKLVNKEADIISKERINSENNMTKITIEEMKLRSNPAIIAAQQAYLAQQQQMQIPNMPQPQDQLVVTGINDPVTQQTNVSPIDNLESQQQDDISDEELQNLIGSVQQQITQPKI